MSDHIKCPFEAGQEYKTRSGQTVRIYSTETGNDTIHGAIYSTESCAWNHMTWCISGRVYANVVEQHPNDIIPPKPPHVWVDCGINDVRGGIVYDGHPSVAIELRSAYLSLHLNRADLLHMLEMLEGGEG